MGKQIHFRAERFQNYRLQQKMFQMDCCSELNFLQKSQCPHVSISPRSGARGLKMSMFEILLCIAVVTNPLAPIWGVDRRMRPLTFSTRFNSKQLLFEVFFLIIGNFGSFQPKVNFLILVHFNISKMQIFEAISSTLGDDRHMRPLTFL